MKLYLMRHGEALSPRVDPQRGLSDNGKASIELVAKYIQEKDITFSQIYHSGKKRAHETAGIIAAITSPDIEIELHQNITPEGDPRLILNKKNTWIEDTLITSHLPFVPNLISLLTGNEAYLTAISFETGTIVCLEKTPESIWKISWSTSPTEVAYLNEYNSAINHQQPE